MRRLSGHYLLDHVPLHVGQPVVAAGVAERYWDGKSGWQPRSRGRSEQLLRHVRSQHQTSAAAVQELLGLIGGQPAALHQRVCQSIRFKKPALQAPFELIELRRCQELALAHLIDQLEYHFDSHCHNRSAVSQVSYPWPSNYSSNCCQSSAVLTGLPSANTSGERNLPRSPQYFSGGEKNATSSAGGFTGGCPFTLSGSWLESVDTDGRHCQQECATWHRQTYRHEAPPRRCGLRYGAFTVRSPCLHRAGQRRR